VYSARVGTGLAEVDIGCSWLLAIIRIVSVTREMVFDGIQLVLHFIVTRVAMFTEEIEEHIAVSSR